MRGAVERRGDLQEKREESRGWKFSRAESSFFGIRKFGVRAPFLDLIHGTTSVIGNIASAPRSSFIKALLRLTLS